MNALPHRLDREIDIVARPETVFRFFTDPARWASWWGKGSTIEPSKGGQVRIRYPEGTEVSGEVVGIDPPREIAFTYGFVSGSPIPAGGSLVTIRVSPSPAGTRVHLTHEMADESARDHHVQGWRFQLSLFANVVAAEVAAGVAESIDAWLSAWAEPDEAARRRMLERVAESDVLVRDRFSNLAGLDEVMPHITAAQHHMPGIRLERRGNIRQCQGTVLAEWQAVGADGKPVGSGTNVCQLSPDGRFVSVTGLWS